MKDWNSNEDISCFEFLNSLSLDENKYVKFYKKINKVTHFLKWTFINIKTNAFRYIHKLKIHMKCNHLLVYMIKFMFNSKVSWMFNTFIPQSF